MSATSAKSGRKGPRPKELRDADVAIEVMRWAVRRHDELQTLRPADTVDAIVEAELAALGDALAGVRLNSIEKLRARVMQDELAADAVRVVEAHFNHWRKPTPASRDANEVLWPEAMLSELLTEAAQLRELLKKCKDGSRMRENVFEETNHKLLQVEAAMAAAVAHNARVSDQPKTRSGRKTSRRSKATGEHAPEYSRVASALIPIGRSIGGAAFKKAARSARTSEDEWAAWEEMVRHLLESQAVQGARGATALEKRTRHGVDFRSGVRHAAATAVAKLLGYADAKSVTNAIERAGRAPHAYSRADDETERRATAARKQIEFQQRVDGHRLARARTEFGIELLAEDDHPLPVNDRPDPPNGDLNAARIAAGGEEALAEALRFKYGLTCSDGLTGNLRLIAEGALNGIRQSESTAQH